MTPLKIVCTEPTIMDKRPDICVVDPDPGLASALGSLLHRYGIGVRRFDTLPGCLEMLDSGLLDGSVMFLDIDVCEAQPATLLEHVRAAAARLSVVAVTDGGDLALRERIVGAGALDLVRRPLLAAYVFNRLREELPGEPGLPKDGMVALSLRDGTQVTFRMMQPEDAEIEQAFVTALSERSRSLRFFSGLRQLPPRLLALLTNPDYPLSYALIATVNEDSRERQIGVARYAPTGEAGVAEFAVVVSDEWQGQGVGSQLLQLVISAAAIAGLRRLEGLILRENKEMLSLAKSLGFAVDRGHSPDLSMIRVVKELTGRRQPSPGV